MTKLTLDDVDLDIHNIKLQEKDLMVVSVVVKIDNKNYAGHITLHYSPSSVYGAPYEPQGIPDTWVSKEILDALRAKLIPVDVVGCLHSIIDTINIRRQNIFN